MVTGLRGIPNIQGGVETHAQHLYPLLANMGCDIEIILRPQFIAPNSPDHWKGISLRKIWSPKASGLEAFVHTFLAILYAGITRPDIVHIHAVGPAIMTPLARILGLKVVVTHHGPDYDREKWGKFPRWILRTGEKLGMKWANQRIVISNVIMAMVKTKYHVDSNLIFNGVTIPELPESDHEIEQFNLTKGRYILQVSRLVPEKRQLDLVKAFIEANLTNWKLVITGLINSDDTYTRDLLAYSHNNNNIIFTDYQSGETLHQLYAHAGMFILPSSHEGLPIALLEAMSYGLPVIASNIPANLEISLDKDQYFELGNISQLSNRLMHFSKQAISDNDRETIRAWVKSKYNWEDIAKLTLDTYQQTM